VTDRQSLRAIGATVNAARIAAGYTQECLAELVGVHWQTISYVESGKVPCSVLTFLKIAQALDISSNRLFDGAGGLDKTRANQIKVAMRRKRKQAT
jgi:DNA-binding XRE family transcriptional regulator